MKLKSCSLQLQVAALLRGGRELKPPRSATVNGSFEMPKGGIRGSRTVDKTLLKGRKRPQEMDYGLVQIWSAELSLCLCSKSWRKLNLTLNFLEFFVSLTLGSKRNVFDIVVTNR